MKISREFVSFVCTENCVLQVLGTENEILFILFLLKKKFFLI